MRSARWRRLWDRGRGGRGAWSRDGQRASGCAGGRATVDETAGEGGRRSPKRDDGRSRGARSGGFTDEHAPVHVPAHVTLDVVLEAQLDELVRLLALVHAAQHQALHGERLAVVGKLLKDGVRRLDALLVRLGLVAAHQLLEEVILLLGEGDRAVRHRDVWLGRRSRLGPARSRATGNNHDPRPPNPEATSFRPRPTATDRADRPPTKCLTDVDVLASGHRCAPLAIGAAVAPSRRRTRTMASVKVTHVILDLDGTLINTGARARRASFASLGPPRCRPLRPRPTADPRPSHPSRLQSNSWTRL